MKDKFMVPVPKPTEKEAKKYSNAIKLPNKYPKQFIKVQELLRKLKD